MASSLSAGRNQTDRFTLSNGLQVVFNEDHSAPVVSVQMWVRTGSADEPAVNAGIAHVFEHMLFKGTQKRGVGEISRDVEASGGDINAFTSYDMTVYFLTMSSRNWRMGMDVISDAIQHSAFDPNELAKEMEVVLEEVRRGEDNPDRQLGHALFETMFTTHPYQRPVIGYSKSVAALDRPTILAFLHTWYRPNNMTLVVAGDIPAKDFRAAVQDMYADFEPGDLPARPRTPEPAQAAPRAKVIRFNTERPRLAVGFPSVNADNTDTVALDILGEIVSSGMNSVLFQEMKRREDLAIGVGAYNYTPRDPGVFEFSASFEPAKLDKGMQRLATLIHDLPSWQFDAGELEAIKARMVADFARERETIRGKAHQLGSYVFYHDDPDYGSKYLQLVRQLTVADLQRVARKYLLPKKSNIVLMLPEKGKWSWDQKRLLSLFTGAGEPDFVPLPNPDPQDLFTHLGKPLGKPLTITKREIIEEGLTRARFDNGLIVLIKEDHKAPLVDIGVEFRGGIRSELPKTSGWMSLMTRLWYHGTGDLSPEQIDRMLSLIGGEAGASLGRDSFSFAGSFLSDKLTTGLRLYARLLTQPSMPDRLLALVKNSTVQQLASLQDNLFRYGLRSFLGKWYGKHPYNHLSEGTTDTVLAATRDDLLKLVNAYIRPEGAVLSVVGDVDTDALLLQLAAELGGWLGAQPATSTVPVVSAPTTATTVVEEIDKEQTHIWWAFPGLTMLDKDRPALDLMDTMLSGMGGRLFTRLRDELSLAYVVTSIQIAPQDPGFFSFYIAGKPDKEQTALEEFAKQITILKKAPPPLKELDRARNYMLGVRDIAREKFASVRRGLSAGQLFYGNPLHSYAYDDNLRKTTVEQVWDVARKILDTNHSLKLILRSNTQKK